MLSVDAFIHESQLKTQRRVVDIPRCLLAAWASPTKQREGLHASTLHMPVLATNITHYWAKVGFNSQRLKTLGTWLVLHFNLCADNNQRLRERAWQTREYLVHTHWCITNICRQDKKMAITRNTGVPTHEQVVQSGLQRQPHCKPHMFVTGIVEDDVVTERQVLPGLP